MGWALLFLITEDETDVIDWLDNWFWGVIYLLVYKVDIELLVLLANVLSVVFDTFVELYEVLFIP
jgi:hypothetical protein